MSKDSKNLTQLLDAARRGDAVAADDLAPLVYDELKRLARYHLRGERSGHTLNTTGLVHEAFIKLVGQNAHYQNRSHFFAVASMTMRRLLVNWARDKKRQKRGAGVVAEPLEERLEPTTGTDAEQILAVHQALDALQLESKRAAKLVECRYFGGLTIEETAETLEVSPATVKREWRLAKAWLARELSA